MRGSDTALSRFLVPIVSCLFLLCVTFPAIWTAQTGINAQSKSAPEADDPPPSKPPQPSFDRIPSVVGDVPEYTVVASLPASDLLKRKQELEKRKCCKACSGRGKVQISVRTGYKEGAGVKKGLLNDPVRELRTFWCDTCDRTGYSNHAALRKQLALTVISWSEVNRDGNAIPTVSSEIAALLKETALCNIATSASIVNVDIIKQIASASLKPGDPVCLIGQVVADQPVSVPKHRSQVISLLDAPNVSVLVLEPIAGDALLWDRTIAGGRFAGWAQGADGGQIAVVVRGFSFTMER